LNITIHNQYPGLKLTSPVYFNTGATYCTFPNQQTDNENTVEAIFGIDPKREYFNGILLYKLQRKQTIKTDNQIVSNIASTKDTGTNIYILVDWNVRHYSHRFGVFLIECTDDFTLDEHILCTFEEICLRQFFIRYEPDIITWSMNDSTVIKTIRNVTYGSDYKLDIVISEGIQERNMEKSIKIDSERLVLSL
jgi:hypothetical protein